MASARKRRHPPQELIDAPFDYPAIAIRAPYPLLRGQNKIKRTTAQTAPQPIHVMFG
jgi:hypothetical protein